GSSNTNRAQIKVGTTSSSAKYGTRVRIIHNTCRKSAAGTQAYYGIRTTSVNSAGDINNCEIIGNDVYNSGDTANISNLGTGTIIRNNVENGSYLGACTLTPHRTPVGITTTSETGLYSSTIPAGRLANAGHRIV